jgi:hypothetical protein
MPREVAATPAAPAQTAGAARAIAAPQVVAAVPAIRAPACVALALALAACSQSDAFIGAQLDHQLRQGDAPTLDLAQVGPANWTRACVLGPYTSDARAAELLGFPWELTRRSDVARRDDRFVLAFSDGRQVLGFVERARADGDFTTLQPPCFARDAARFATRREAGGGLVVVARPVP